MKFIQLKSQIKIPIMGIGTDRLSGDFAVDVISQALNIGYRLIDTATAYKNHTSIAKTIKNFNRSELYLCTKFNNEDLNNSSVFELCDKILVDLETDYIDLLLIHNPIVNNLSYVLKFMVSLKQSGKIRSIGVSNFTIKHLNAIKDNLKHIDINQIEFHPYLNQKELFDYCSKQNIHIMAYRPFCNGYFFSDRILKNIAKNHNKTIPQIVLKWLIHKELVTIAMSTKYFHLKENLELFDFELSEMDCEMINSINKNLRTCFGTWSDFDD